MAGLLKSLVVVLRMDRSIAGLIGGAELMGIDHTETRGMCLRFRRRQSAANSLGYQNVAGPNAVR